MKKFATAFTAFVMLLGQALSITNVFAAQPPSANYAILGFSGNPTIADASDVTSVDVTFTNGKVTVSGTGLYAQNTNVYAPAGSNVSLTATGNGSYVGELIVNGAKVTTFPYEIQNLIANNFVNIDTSFSIPPATATVTYTPTGNPVDRIAINNGEYDFEHPNNPVTYDYDGSNKVTIELETLATIQKLTTLKINGTTYTAQLPSTKEQLLNAVDGQTIHYVFNDVDYAATYAIETTTEPFDETTSIVGSFLWSYKDEDKGTDDYVGNGQLELIKIKYNGVEYTPDQLSLDQGYLQWGEAPGANFGGALLPVGTEVTVRLLPNVGYQLTSFTINGGEFTAQEEVGVYTFDVPAGNFHLGAHFTKVNNAVNTDEADAVTSGSIKLGNGEIDNGTARLDVKNATDINPSTIEGFEENSGDYNLKTILDIKLFNTIYKGTADDTWDEQLDELNREATITLKLDEGIDGNDIVIIHEKHDGTYEVIPTTYDPVAHTITFRTSSFSNYAIATRTIGSPDTGVMTKENASASENTDVTIQILGTLALWGLVAFIAKKGLA